MPDVTALFFRDGGRKPARADKPVRDWCIGTTVTLTVLAGGVWAWFTSVTIPLLPLLVLIALAAVGLWVTGRRVAQRLTRWRPIRQPTRNRAAPPGEAAPGAPPAQPLTAWQATAGGHDQLIGDADRNAAIDLLNQRYATGHLDREARDQRCAAALNATTRGELASALIHLPH